MTSIEKKEAQTKYCKEKKLPNFANTLYCFCCNKDIWEGISDEKASTELITGCPHCFKSFVD